jgi:hypothetical protein
MAPGSRCIGILSETQPELPIAPNVAHPNSLIWKNFEENVRGCPRAAIMILDYHENEYIITLCITPMLVILSDQ